jgi:hypothetical protein
VGTFPDRTMARYVDEGVFPLPREALWKFLELHVRDDTISQIHPGVLRQETISAANDEYLMRRTLDARGTPRTVLWKIRYHRPDWARWETTEAPEGPFVAGSHLENHYTEDPGGTRIRTDVDIALRGVPGLFQKRIVRSVIGTIDDEDLAYVRAHPPG